MTPSSRTRPLARERVAVVSSGFAEGPAQALVEYLRRHRAPLVVHLAHPLTAEDPNEHRVTVLRDGAVAHERAIRRPSRPPLSYALDLTAPLLPPRVDTWVGFNCLAAGQGLLARAAGRARRVVLWSVDFVPDRFGPATPVTRAYDALDALCCRRADLRVELSEAAAAGRAERHGLGANAAPVTIVPMGTWLDRVPAADPSVLRAPRVVYLGHLVPRQGVAALIRALGLLARDGRPLPADVIGRGPDEPALRELAAAEGVGELVRFHGFVPDHRDVEALLAGGAVAAAPYDDRGDSFSRFADPGKLKAYLGAGLPIVLTDVPPNARELAAEAGAEVVAFDPRAIADALLRAVGDHATWERRAAAARAYAARFDWERLLSPL